VTQTLTTEAVARLARSTPRRVRNLTALGLLVAEPDGYSPGDVHRIRLIDAFERSGVPAEALATAAHQGTISFAFYDEVHPDPGTASTTSFGDLLSDMGTQGPKLVDVLTTVGLPVPDPEDHLSTDEEDLLREVTELLDTADDPDLTLQVLHILGDFARRSSQAALSIYDEARGRAESDIVDESPERVYDIFLEPWARLARSIPRLARWLSSRHLTSAIDGWSVEATERLLASTGYVPPRRIDDPAVAFIDLTAFTRLTAKVGDREAARVAARFMDLAGDVTDRIGGRVVKHLGDGVLTSFPNGSMGVRAVLEILDQLEEAALPRGHAGIASGPVVAHAGDIFGSTVNRASRIADAAPSGEFWAEATFAGALPDGEVRIDAVGPTLLHGFTDPMEMVRLRPTAEA
jgi:adenylate cyclase